MTKASLGEFARALQRRTRLTAVGVGVMACDSEPQFAVVGERVRGSGVEMAADDLWHIGSITKSATALLIASLFESEPDAFDIGIARLLPDLTVHPSWHGCTLQHLMNHTSGLPANFSMAVMREAAEQDNDLEGLRARHLQTLLSRPVQSAPGTRFRYSNVGYILLGHIAAVRSERTFEQALRERVLQPLELGSAGFGPPKGEDALDQPQGHQVLFGLRKARNPHRESADNPPLIGPAGRLHMNLEHLLKYGHAHLMHHPMLRPQTWVKLHTPALRDYACGMICHPLDWANGDVLWHNGSNTMWYAQLMVFPARNVVLALVTNDGAIWRAERAFWKAARELIELA